MWKGVHIGISAKKLPALQKVVADDLVPMGVNALVLEINYNFAFRSHPELQGGDPITTEQAGDLARFCKQQGVRLIPQFQCLGHQSWAKTTFPLLVKYPELDETPQIPLDNPDIYCRSWCPLHPKVNEIVFPLMDEMIDAFQADAFHVGMDEVFLIGSEQCSRCHGKDPADLFAHAVNDYHRHLVKHRKVEMMMWADRFLDAKVFPYGKWEGSENGTAPALAKISKDIVLCDWHYEKMAAYPSVPYFQEQGFRVWPAGWKDVDAVEALIDYSLLHQQGRMVGYLATVWGRVPVEGLGRFAPLQTAMKSI